MSEPAADLGRISATGLRAIGYHGVHPEERTSGQPFVVDVAVLTDVGPAARSDDVALTVDYSRIATLVVALIEGEPCNLIETLAVRILDAVTTLDGVRGATVTVHKPNAPVGVAFEDISVTVSRGQ